MVDKDLIISKADSVTQHLKRVNERISPNADGLLQDDDLRDIVLFNLQMAIQNCIDIAAHIISEEGIGVPESNSEMFDLLEQNGHLDPDTAQKMIKAVGFRNLIVHEYSALDLQQVHKIARSDVKDMENFLRCIFNSLGFESS